MVRGLLDLFFEKSFILRGFLTKVLLWEGGFIV